MDRLVALFEQLSLAEVARVVRRTSLVGAVLGVLGLIVSAVFSHVLLGLGLLVGLGLGLANIKIITGSLVQVGEHRLDHPRRVLASGTLARLGITTVVVLALLVASLQLGFGAVGGVALFYLLVLVSLLRVLVAGPPDGVSH